MSKTHRPARLTDLDSEQLRCFTDPARRAEAHGMLDDLEARCDMDVSALRAVLPARSKLQDVLSLYAVHTVNTGGGCMAYRLDTDDGGYILVTDEDGAGPLPADDADRVLCGRYDWRGDTVGGDDNTPVVGVDELERWIDRALRDADPRGYWQQIGLDALSKEYQDWCDQHGLPVLSADDLIHTELTAAQRKMVSAFIQVWEAVEA